MFDSARACGFGLRSILLASSLTLNAAVPLPGSLDTTFQPEFGGVNGPVNALLVQRDGRIVVTQAPLFHTPNGEGISRWLPDGRVDESFQIGAGSDQQYAVKTIVEQIDGKLVIGGLFTGFNSEPRRALVRLHTDGRIDQGFNPTLPDDVPWIWALAIDPNGKLLIGGPSYLARLSDDGSFDPAFVRTQIMSSVQKIAVTTNRIYIAGVCAGPDGCFPLRALRLDGTPDPTFSLNTNWLGNSIDTLLVQPDGKLIIGPPWLRLNADGSQDASFQIAQDVIGYHRQTALTPAGKLLLVGVFESAGGITNGTHAVQFNADGSLDTNFARVRLDGFYPALYSCGVQTNGQIVVGGYFDHVNGIPRNYIARLNGDTAPPLPSLGWSADSYSVSETNTSIVVTIKRTGELGGATLANYATADETARASTDYETVAGEVRFVTGESAKEVIIPIHDNRLVDGTRAFTITLSNVLGAELGSNSVATAAILDDEVNNRVQFAATHFPVKETQSNALVEVVRDFGSTGAVSVGYAIHDDDTAQAGRDYLAVSGTIHFVEGQFTNWFLVPILNTPDADGNRYAQLELLSPQNGAVFGQQSNAVLALLDDESPAVVAAPLEAFVRAAVAGGGSRVEFGTDVSIAMRSALNINADVTLDGGTNVVMLSGEGATRLFNVATGVNLTLKNLTLANGFSTNGGAIWNEGNLTLVNCTFSNNVARGVDGRDGAVREAVMGEDGGHGQAGRGGALVNLGRVMVTNCLFIGNAAFGGRGGDGGAGGLGTNYWEQFPGGNGGNSGVAQGGSIFSVGPVIAGQTRFYSNVAGAGRSGVGGRGTVTNVWLGWSQTFNAHGGTNGLAADAQGGAIDITGSLACVGCEFLANEAVGGLGSASVGNGDGTDYRSAFPGLPGSNGGNAAGGSVHATGDAFFQGSSFIHNIARGGSGGLGGGGGSGEGIARVWPNNGGDGGRGGAGGEARSGAIDLIGGTLNLQGCSLESNRAIGGDASNGGHGGVAGGNGFGGGAAGAGGDGGDGGGAIAGAIFAEQVGTFLSNRFEGNSAIGGLAANGSQSGQRCCRYSDSAPAGNGGAGGDAVAGAVFIQRAAPMIASSVFVGNAARAGVGGIGARGTDFTGGSSFSSAANSGGNGGDGGDAQAGALMLDAPAAISNCTFSFSASLGGNAGPGGTGGASYADAGNGGLSGRGGRASAGAVFSSQALSIADSFLTTNTALAGDANVGGNGGNLGGYGGTIAYPYMLGSGAPGANGGDAKGGALFLASNVVSISRVRLIANTTHAGAGGQAGTNGGISYGTGPLLVSPEGGSGGGAFGGGIFAEQSRVALVDSTFESNATIGGVSGASGTGGRSLTTIGGQTHPGWPSRSGVPGGEARGAGLCSEISDVAVSRCTFHLNAAVGGQGAMGGARFDIADNGGTGGIGGGASGGALAQFGGSAFLTNSTFHSNSVVGGVGGMGGANNSGAPGGIGGDGFGGALHSVTGAVVLVNASLVENFAAGGAGGSGGTGETNTLGPIGASGNGFGGALANVDAQFSIVNSLFKHRANASSALGAFIDLGHNISSDASFAFTESSSRNNLDPLVGPLADNGGPTRTLALLSGSPAIDAGDDEACPPTDQRGVTRPFGGHCDVGAFELSERTFSISGRVKAHGTVAGVVVSVGGASAMTDSSGLYTLRNLIGDRYEVRPLGAGRFSPARRVVTVGPDARQINFNAHLPRLRATTIDNRGTVVLHLTDLADDSYVLETSTNLVDWTEVEAISADRQGSAVVKQMVNTNDARRYFRLGER